MASQLVDYSEQSQLTRVDVEKEQNCISLSDKGDEKIVASSVPPRRERSRVGEVNGNAFLAFVS